MTAPNTAYATLVIAALAAWPACAATPPRPQPTLAQQSRAAWVERQVLRADQAYSSAYNACARHRLRRLFTVDATLHPAGAPAAGTPGDLRAVLQPLGSPDCGRLRREVELATLVVRPLPGEAAVQAGRQRYCSADGSVCAAPWIPFVAVWRYRDHAWKIHRLRWSEEALAAAPPKA